MKTAVVIARFQTPYLHEGHKSLISQVKETHSRVIILLGVSPITGSRKNPYDYYTREKMIKASYPEIIVLPVSDHPSDKIWSENLDNLLKGVFPNEQFTLYGSRDSFIPYYQGKFETIELPNHGDYNATELRKQYADKVFDSNDFRAGILYALYNQYTKVYPTVDIALFRNEKTEILLVTGIANPRPLKGFLEERIETYYMMSYNDHHIFSMLDWKDIRKRFESIQAEKKIILTTEKDAMRLLKFSQEMNGMPFYVLPIEHKFLFNQENEFNDLVIQFIQNFKHPD